MISVKIVNFKARSKLLAKNYKYSFPGKYPERIYLSPASSAHQPKPAHNPQHQRRRITNPLPSQVVYITCCSNGLVSLQKSYAPPPLYPSHVVCNRGLIVVSSSVATASTMTSVVKNIVEKQIAENPVVVYSKSTVPILCIPDVG